MNTESVRNFCLSLPMATEDLAFGDGVLLFRVCNKIFACTNLEGEPYLTLKCDPDYAIDLRDRYDFIDPAYHWNKKYWNQMPLRDNIDSNMVKDLILHSYRQVVAKLPRKLKAEHPELTV